MDDCCQMGKPSWYVTSHRGQLSLDIPPWYVQSVPAKAGTQTGTPRDALAPYCWSGSVSRCLAEG